MIAGHLFSETPNGRVCSCGARWVDVLLARREDVGQPGFAHTGYLTDHEYAQIEEARERLYATIF
jgi:hypothetical protein